MPTSCSYLPFCYLRAAGEEAAESGTGPEVAGPSASLVLGRDI